MTFRYFTVVLSLLLSIQFISAPAEAQATNWDAVFAEWSRSFPDKAAQWKKAEKDAEKQEKRIKDFADKTFQSSFDSIYGKDKYKPSDALDVLKVLEAASAGDYEFAGKTSSSLLIAKYVPVLGQYITAMKTAVAAIKAGEQAWIKGLERTKAYEQFLQIFHSQSTLRNPYIPSYMITYLRNNKQFGAEITKIYDDMRARETAMFKEWTVDNFEIDRLALAPWASQWRSARGKVPSDKEMFNYFLYKNTHNNKPRYMEKFVDEYMRPLIARAAYGEKQRFAQAMTAALNQISAQAAGNGMQAQCTAWATEYKTLEGSAKNLHAQILAFHTKTSKALASKFIAVIDDDLDRKREALRSERAKLEAEDREVKRLIGVTNAIVSRLNSIQTEIAGIHASLPAKSETEAYNAIAATGRAAQRRLKTMVETGYEPAKAAQKAAIVIFDRNLEQFRAKEKELNNQKRPAFGTKVKPFLDAIEVFTKDRVSCGPFARVATGRNLQGLVGLNPSSYVSACQAFTQQFTRLQFVATEHKTKCGKK